MPVRARLTAVYGSLFFLTAGALVVINYFTVNKILYRRFTVRLPGAPLPDLPAGVPTGKAVLIQQFSKSELSGGDPGDTLFIRSVSDEVERFRQLVMDSMLQWSLLSTLLIGLFGLAVGWLVAKRALAPLHTVTETARTLSGSTLHERIALDGPRDEIRDLADTFDSMLERLDTAFDSQRRFVANASHELRTPLAINRALLQVSFADPDLPEQLRSVGAELLAANARQERLIDGLLLLAQTERELTTRESADLEDLAGAVVAAAPGHPQVRAHLAAAPVTGDPVLLERMIGNLVDNAAKYNDERGEVHVRSGADGAASFVTVENTGPVVAPDQVAVLFEPFRRLGGDRTGSARGAGLGLSIVRAVATAHGGTAEARPRPGGGLVVTVRLPRAPAGSPALAAPHGRAHDPGR
ncbi:sensor histidine kinase [Microbispora sp. ATCC PTA-5024]|uniref:sensor histidine kinase n=1 Tax=Microbispora sp. ATCC PTA-5024 TaxID=316330 RepID=UPI0003DD199A|nr:HAMP domain-containing sensor histidine kinase [Microbispora sp. ATCC PTA-5024]ETK32216.1 hypothetical protein MPTA5024_30805 [Microbispora sp. ATCC PTA-5024]